MPKSYSIIIKKKKYFLLENKKEITINNKKIVFDSKDEALNFEKRILEINSELPHEIIALFYFSSKLQKENRMNIVSLILEKLTFDNLLYLSPIDKEINVTIRKNQKKYVSIFEKKFDLKFTLLESSIDYQINLFTNKFKIYLENLSNEGLTVFYKFTQLNSSPILTYLFYEERINLDTLYKISNFEDIYNEKKWGKTDEKMIINKNLKKTFKNLLNFFRLIT